MQDKEMMEGLYILDGHDPVKCEDAVKFSEMMRDIDRRRVALDIINDEIEISTVFYGCDYGCGERRPVVFETLVRGGNFDDIDRYCTWEAAEKGHKRMVEKIREALK